MPISPIFKRVKLPALLLVLIVSGACARRSRPAPPPQIVVNSTPDQPAASTIDPSAAAPIIEVLVDPPSVVTGESATLEWQSQNAERVVIDHDIGAVDPSGRLKVFPDVTTRYRVRAEGPGGSTEVEVQIDVRGIGQLNDSEMADLSITQLFATFVRPVFFDFDSSSLSEDSRLILDGNIRWLNRTENSLLQFIVEGHCDQRGTESYNLALGDQRAQAVREYLIQNGIDQNRILTLSLGEERPVAGGDDEESYTLNRRAQFVLVSEE